MIYRLGAIPDPVDPRDHVYRLAGAAMRAAQNGDLPERIDNREYCTAVRNQGDEASCVGHAVSGIAELMYWKSLGKRPAFSPRWAYNKAQEHDHIPGSGYDGTTVRGGLKAWKAEGMATDADWPYLPKTETAKAQDCEKHASVFRLPGYERLHGIAEAKHAIHQYSAVLATVMTHDGWNSPGAGIIIRRPGDDDGGYHAIYVVGYDDPTRFFTFPNSWGVDWADHGFGKLSYQDFESQVTDCWLPLAGVMTWAGRVWAKLAGLWR